MEYRTKDAVSTHGLSFVVTFAGDKVESYSIEALRLAALEDLRMCVAAVTLESMSNDGRYQGVRWHLRESYEAEQKERSRINEEDFQAFESFWIGQFEKVEVEFLSVRKGSLLVDFGVLLGTLYTASWTIDIHNAVFETFLDRVVSQLHKLKGERSTPLKDFRDSEAKFMLGRIHAFKDIIESAIEKGEVDEVSFKHDDVEMKIKFK